MIDVVSIARLAAKEIYAHLWLCNEADCAAHIAKHLQEAMDANAATAAVCGRCRRPCASCSGFHDIDKFYRENFVDGISDARQDNA